MKHLKKIEDAFKKFSCQRETDLEDFLIHKAIAYEKANFGKTYLCIDSNELEKGEFVILAYFTIAHRSVSIAKLSNNKKRKLLGEYPGRDHLDSVPAFLIGQLGRCDKCTKSHIPGKQLLNECYHAISEAQELLEEIY